MCNCTCSASCTRAGPLPSALEVIDVRALQACANLTPEQAMQMVRLFAETLTQQQRLVRQRQGLTQLLVS